MEVLLCPLLKMRECAIVGRGLYGGVDCHIIDRARLGQVWAKATVLFKVSLPQILDVTDWDVFGSGFPLCCREAMKSDGQELGISQLTPEPQSG